MILNSIYQSLYQICPSSSVKSISPQSIMVELVQIHL